MDLQLKDTHILITGATRGIGRAIALTAAEEGANISFCARDVKAVEDFQNELTSKGVRAFGRALDVADENALSGFINDAANHFGRLDGVVANASALVDGASRDNSSDSRFMDIVGFVPRENFIGRYWFRYFSISHAPLFGRPAVTSEN